MRRSLSVLFAGASICGFLLAQTASQSEDSSAPKTKLESFLAQKGSIIVKEFHPLGIIQGELGSSVKLETLVLYEPGKEQQLMRGIRILVTGSNRDVERISFLDMDELDSLAKGLDYMSKVMADWAGTNRDYTEMIFSTKGDFDVGFYIQKGKIGAFMKSGSISIAKAYLQPKDLRAMREQLEQGRTFLTSKSAP